MVSRESLTKIDAIFREMDTNNDGKLSLDEVAKYQANL